jgi:hypothetical protein
VPIKDRFLGSGPVRMMRKIKELGPNVIPFNFPCGRYICDRDLQFLPSGFIPHY